jgi:glycosyltransferase involved in cell wall biosynthesis
MTGSGNPKVSILMNCYNGQQYLREAIDSVYAQTFADWEIIFIDNCSTDASGEIAKSYDERLKYFKTEENIPLYAARNFGLNFVNGDFLAFLDVDDSWLPTKLEEQLQVFAEFSDCMLVYSAYFVKREDASQKRFVVSKDSAGWGSFDRLLYSYTINIPTVMIRYNGLPEELQKFNCQLNLSGDYVMFMKIAFQFRIFFIDKPLAVKREHANNLTNKLKGTQLIKEIVLPGEDLFSSLELSAEQQKRLLFNRAKDCFYAYLAENNNRKARYQVKEYLFFDKRIFVLYWLSLLPFSGQVIRRLRLFLSHRSFSKK